MKPERTILFSDYAVRRPSDAQKEDCIRAALAAQRLPTPRSESLLGQAKTQLAYIGLWFWLGILALATVLALFCRQISAGTQAPGSGIFPTLMLFSITGPAVAALAAPLLARSYTWQMWELEEAAFHNLARLTSLRLVIAFLAGVPVLFAMGLAGLEATGLLPGLFALSIPFLLACGATYCILGRLRGTPGSLCSVGTCLLLGILCVVAQSMSAVQGFMQGSEWLACCTPALALAVVFYIISARGLIRKSHSY